MDARYQHSGMIKKAISQCLTYKFSAALYSSRSPGWQDNSRQMASSVVTLMALAFPVFNMDKLELVIPTF